MNVGKEPFKCGMESAECGVRPNLISVISKLRAPRHATRPLSFDFSATSCPCGIRISA
jgi:hypothetical protein